MVNITALQKIDDFILSNNLGVMRKWSERALYEPNTKKLLTYSRVMVQKIRKILVLLSGNEIAEMLKDVLNDNERDELSSPELKQALRNLAPEYDKTNLKERHKIVRPLKHANLKYSNVRRLGFSISRPLWRNCQERRPKNLGGNSSIPLSLQKGIEEYLHEHSSIASNRLVQVKNKKSTHFKRFIPARYLHENKTELFKKSPFQNLISKTTFLKYAKINNEFKQPHRMTDLCEYCEREIMFRKQISKAMKDENYAASETIDITKIREYFNSKAVSTKKEIERAESINAINIDELKSRLTSYKSILDTIRDYEVLLFHKNVARCQRLAYNKHHKNSEFLKHKILIEIDYKQKIAIGMSPRQVSAEYYNQVLRSCLGFGIYYVDENSKIQLINFDLISSDLTQDAFSVVRALRLLRKQAFFKAIEKMDYIVWMDTGKCFRNNEILGYFLLELAKDKIHVNLNYFAEKHGKNGRDAHFSNIARFIKAESLVRRLSTSQDIVDSLVNRQKMANENNKGKFYFFDCFIKTILALTLKDLESHVKLYALALDLETDQSIQREFPKNFTLTVANLESFYNYRTLGDKFELVTSVLSYNENCKKLEVVNSETKHNTYSVVNETPCAEINVHYMTLQSKKQRIKAALLQIKAVQTNEQIEMSKELFDYFSLQVEPHEENTARVKPQFCRSIEDGTMKKPACVECIAICAFSLEDILNEAHGIGQHDLVAELKAHKHPSSRNMTKTRQRNTRETARELADHYMFAHNLKELEIY